MCHVNELINAGRGIFAERYVDADGLPIADTFAAEWRVALFGAIQRTFLPAQKAAQIGAFHSAGLLNLAAGVSASFVPGTTPPGIEGIYLLRSGEFARWSRAGWHKAAKTPELAQMSPVATKSAPVDRGQSWCAWVGTVHGVAP